MPKVITSPSSRWPGQVSLSSPMTLPQALAWEKAIRAGQSLTGDVTLTDLNYAMLPGVCACVEKWELEGMTNVTPDTFPATPRKDSAELLNWLIGEITRVYVGEEEKADPNE
jgi:hypothetical protein